MNSNEFDRLVRMKELKQLIGLSNASIYRHIKNGTFPKQIHLSERCVAWRLSSVEKWIKEKAYK
jgi:prophage regulatory protein